MLVDAATLVIGTPTVMGGPHPGAVAAAYLTTAPRPPIRFASVIGSYGWGSKAVEQSGGHTRWWRQPLSVFEMAAWLAALWFIGFWLTGALLSNNLPSVRLGDPSLPYLLAGIGYPALVLVTTSFAVRFVRACDGQQPSPESAGVLQKPEIGDTPVTQPLAPGAG